VVAVEQNKQGADSGWKQEKAFFRECIRKEKPSSIVHPDLV
jgi:hypothetical protein